MTVRKVVAGSVLAAGVGVAGMLGAGTAAAGPGISIDPGTDGKGSFGLGDQTKQVAAKATEGNTAFAVSLFSPATATVGGNANEARRVRWVSPQPRERLREITGNVKGGGAYTLDGHTKMAGNANGTQVFNVYSNVVAAGEAGASTTLAVCGTQVTAQAAHVTVSKGCNN